MPRLLDPTALEPLLLLARGAIDQRLTGVAADRPPLPAGIDRPARAVFVTLWTLDGSLRGCIGSLDPVAADLSGEVMRCAVLAATEDPRFPSVEASELAELTIEVSVLGPSELVDDRRVLDPRRYGIVVSSGRRRGVLLPGIDGVETAEEQIEIACRKAGITLDEEIELQRFEVVKVGDPIGEPG